MTSRIRQGMFDDAFHDVSVTLQTFPVSSASISIKAYVAYDCAEAKEFKRKPMMLRTGTGTSIGTGCSSLEAR